MVIASINGQVVKTFSKMRIKHPLLEARLVDDVIAPGMDQADMDAAEIARPQKSVLYVTLAEKLTMKGLAAAILSKFDTDLTETSTNGE